MKIGNGDFNSAKHTAALLYDIGNEYNYEFARIVYHDLMAKILMNEGDLNQAYQIASAGEKLSAKQDMNPRRILFLAIITRIEILKNNLNDAKNAIDKIDELIRNTGDKTILPWLYKDWINTKSFYYLSKHQRAVSSQEIRSDANIKNIVFEAVKRCVKYTNKRIPSNRVEAYKYVGSYHSLTGKQNIAINWYKKSINVGKRLGAQLELSHELL